MGDLYIDWVVDLYRGAGLDAVGVSGWERRARGSGGFPNGRVEAIFQHHTAGGYDPNHDWASANYGIFGHPDKPCANEYIARSGRIWVGAAGAANTQGAGGPLGTLPKDGANARSWAKEICNRGTGEPYPQVQQDVVLESTAVLAADFIRRGYFTVGELAQWRNSTHYIWAPTRKIDCWGPSRWSDGAKWHMDRFNHELFTRVNQILGFGTPPPAAPDPTPGLDPTMPQPTLRMGSSGQEVTKLINVLKYCHWYPAEYQDDTNDGQFGQRADTGTRNMQQALGVVVDGVYGPQTAFALQALIQGSAPAPTPPPPAQPTPQPPPPPPPTDPLQAEKDRRSARISNIGLYRLKPHATWGVQLPYGAAQSVYGDGNRSGELSNANNPWPSVLGSRIWVPNTAGVLLVAMPGDSPWSMCELIYGSQINDHMNKFIDWNGGAGIVAGETYFLPTL